MIETILSAGLTGLVGNAISTIFTFVNQRQKNKHDLSMKKLDIESRVKDAEIVLKSMVKEAELNIQITETKIQGDLAVSEMSAFNETIKQNAVDKLSGTTLDKLFANKWTMPFGVFIAMMFGFIDFLKGVIRPGITLYMTVAVTWIYFQAMATISASGELFGSEVSLQLFQQITDNILFVFVTTVLWHFGDRRIAKTINRTNNWKK